VKSTPANASTTWGTPWGDRAPAALARFAVGLLDLGLPFGFVDDGHVALVADQLQRRERVGMEALPKGSMSGRLGSARRARG
jgi:hypothetical protein